MQILGPKQGGITCGAIAEASGYTKAINMIFCSMIWVHHVVNLNQQKWKLHHKGCLHKKCFLCKNYFYNVTASQMTLIWLHARFDWLNLNKLTMKKLNLWVILEGKFQTRFKQVLLKPFKFCMYWKNPYLNYRDMVRIMIELDRNHLCPVTHILDT